MKMQRTRSCEDDLERSAVSQNKDFSFRLVKVVTVMVIFIAGAVFGLVASAHVTGFFKLGSHNDLFFPVSHHQPPPLQEKKVSCVDTTVCQTEDCLNFTTFLHPRKSTHSMKDQELFWRASMVPKKEEYPYKRLPKVAFMFLTRGPLPLSPLWDRFFKGHDKFFSVYVHALPGYNLNVTNTSAFYRRQIPSQDVKWGSIELADGERRLLANALLEYSNERFVLLSESCIPVYDFDTVYKYLMGSAHSFVEAFDDPSRYGRGRYHRYMFPEIKLHQWRKGSQWFEMSRALAVYIVSDTKYYDLFRKYCKPSCYPDEHYLPTYLNMFFPALNSNRSVTWVDWSRGGPHPATFGKADITEAFIQAIRNNGTLCPYNSEQTNVCYLFARKFAPSALNPLLRLASKIMKF